MSTTTTRSSSSPRSRRLEGWISAGFFVFDSRCSTTSTATTASSNASRSNGWPPRGELMVYRHEGFFFAMDTYREYELLNELWDRGEAPWKVWGEGEGRNELLLAG